MMKDAPPTDLRPTSYGTQWHRHTHRNDEQFEPKVRDNPDCKYNLKQHYYTYTFDT